MRGNREKRAIARAVHNLALYVLPGDLNAARALNQESISSAARSTISTVWDGTSQRGEVLLDQGELVAAKQAEEEALAIKRKTGEKRGIAYALFGLGKIAFASGDLAAAARLQPGALAMRVELKAKNTEGRAGWRVRSRSKKAVTRRLYLARQAAEEFHRSKAVHTEVQAQSLMALTRVAQRALPTRSG